jgi:hypothetical protein
MIPDYLKTCLEDAHHWRTTPWASIAGYHEGILRSMADHPESCTPAACAEAVAIAEAAYAYYLGLGKAEMEKAS